MLAVIGIGGGDPLQGLRQGIALGIIGIGSAALPGQAVVGVVAVGRADPVDHAQCAVANGVVGIAGIVVAVDRVGGGFAGQPVQRVIGVTGAAAT